MDICACDHLHSLATYNYDEKTFLILLLKSLNYICSLLKLMATKPKFALFIVLCLTSCIKLLTIYT